MKDCYLARKEEQKAAAEEAARGSQGRSDDEVEQQESGDLFGFDSVAANQQAQSAFKQANSQFPSDGELHAVTNHEIIAPSSHAEGTN